MQEVSVVLWAKFDTLHEAADLRLWACGVARMEVLAWMRDPGRDRLVLDEAVVIILAGESIGKEARLERQREALESCIERIALLRSGRKRRPARRPRQIPV